LRKVNAIKKASRNQEAGRRQERRRGNCSQNQSLEGDLGKIVGPPWGQNCGREEKETSEHNRLNTNMEYGGGGGKMGPRPKPRKNKGKPKGGGRCYRKKVRE